MKTYDFSVTYEYVQPYLPTKRSRKIRYAIQTDTTHVSVPIVGDWLCPSNNTISSSIWTHCYRVDQINRIAETETAFRKAYAQTHNIGRKYPKDPTEIQKIFLDSIESLPGFSAYLHLGIDNREEQDQRYVFDIQKAESVFKLPSEGQYTIILEITFAKSTPTAKTKRLKKKKKIIPISRIKI